MSTNRRAVLHDDPPAQVRFEEDRVKMVLGAFGLTDAKWELLDAHERRAGTRRLTFDGFFRRFPTFPVVLAARYVGGVGERVEVADLFRRPHKLFLADLYAEVFARHQNETDDRPVGLVVPFAGFRGGLVLHNGLHDTGGPRLRFPLPDDEPPYRLTAEPFGLFLTHLAAGGWEPHAATGHPLPVERPEPDGLPTVIDPRVLRRLGTGPAFVLYLCLTGLLASPLARHRGYVRRGRGGERRLALTHDELAAESGMSPDAIKRGLAVLKREGLVDTHRGDGHTLFVVHRPDDDNDGDR